MKNWALLLLLLIGIEGCTHTDTYLYTRRYFPTYTNIGATTGRFLLPTLKTEYGVENEFAGPYNTFQELDIRLRASIQGLTDPPESWEIDYKLGKRFGEKSYFKNSEMSLITGRRHNISRPDYDRPKGFGLHYTGVEIGYHFK